MLLVIVLIAILYYGSRILSQLTALNKRLDRLDVNVARKNQTPHVGAASGSAPTTDLGEDAPLISQGSPAHVSVDTNPDSNLDLDSSSISTHDRTTLQPDAPVYAATDFNDDAKSLGPWTLRPSQSDVPSQQQPHSAIGDRITSHVGGDIHNDDVLVRFFSWMRDDWPLKVGGLLIILAVGWFISYAATVGWLTEMMRVVLGYIFGVSAIAYGAMRVGKVTSQGNTFLIIGIAAIFVATLAGVHFASVQMPPVLALLVMLFTVFFVTLISLQQRKINLTGCMLFFGGIIPLFFFKDLAIEMIFAYLFALTLGTLWVVAKTGWRALTLMMLCIVAFYSVGHALTGTYSTSLLYMMLAIVFTALFYGANVSSIVRSRSASMIDVVSAVGVTMLYLFWVYVYGPESFRIALLLLGAVLFVSASYGIFHATRLTTPTIIYGAAAFILIGVATAEVFNGSQLTIAYLLEVTVGLGLAIYVRGSSLRTNHQVAGMILFAAPLLMVVQNIMNVSSHTSGSFRGEHVRGEILLDLFVILLAAVCAFVLSFLVRRCCYFDEGATQSEGVQLYARVFGYLGLGLLVTLIWFGAHVFIVSDAVATFSALFIYMVSGVAFYVYGARRADRGLLGVGAILFAIVLGRIGLVEFWQMPITMRIVTFFVIGALFVVAAYAARAYKK